MAAIVTGRAGKGLWQIATAHRHKMPKLAIGNIGTRPSRPFRKVADIAGLFQEFSLCACTDLFTQLARTFDDLQAGQWMTKR
ncbi:hypothetical protein [Devosia sp. MC532]|uniref:hypothetical protein n=1 Tax=Devosia sp. MC532 TaxID=2799788 RepID=UPI0020BDB7B7|nr:hypothetical protein [Devosia sp. MC532]